MNPRGFFACILQSPRKELFVSEVPFCWMSAPFTKDHIRIVRINKISSLFSLAVTTTTQ